MNGTSGLTSVGTLSGSPSGIVSLTSAPTGLESDTARLSSLLIVRRSPRPMCPVAIGATSVSVSQRSIGGGVALPRTSIVSTPTWLHGESRKPRALTA